MQTFSVIRFTYPDDMSSSDRVHLMGSLSRFCDKYSGRVITSPDFTFCLTDLDGQKVGDYTLILSAFDCVYKIQLLSMAFFDKLLGGSFTSSEVA